MDVRKPLALLVAVPSLLVATALPSHAATTGMVTFAGTLRITPTASPGTGNVDVCFFGLATTCANSTPSSGVAAGADLTQAVDGLQAHATYTEVCAPVTGLAATGSATITANVHQLPSSTWSGPISAIWQRVGLVAVIQGGATGAAVFAPIGPATCGTPVVVVVAGVAVFTA